MDGTLAPRVNRHHKSNSQNCVNADKKITLKPYRQTRKKKIKIENLDLFQKWKKKMMRNIFAFCLYPETSVILYLCGL